MKRRLNHHLLLALLSLVAAFVVAPAASAAALTTVVEIGQTAGSITPATIEGSVGDTFQVHNAGPNDYPGYDFIVIENRTGAISLSGSSCADSGMCRILDASTETFTVITPGTFTITRYPFGIGEILIGTLTISAPVVKCDSSKWNFGVVDFSQGFGDQILVTWQVPTVSCGTATTFTLFQATAADGAETAVNSKLCSSTLSGLDGSSKVELWSCALKTASVTANQLWFRAVATTSSGAQATSRQVKWMRGQTPDADVVSFGTGTCGVSTTMESTMSGRLVCFIIELVLQTEFASNGNQTITDKQAREILNVGVAFSDAQSARQGRAAKAKWVSIGKKTIKIKKGGKLRISLPISKRGRALLKKGPLKVRVTYTLTRGANERRIVKFVTLPRIAS